MNKLEIKQENIASIVQKEVYRNLRTNIEFTGMENRVIAVTSCAPGDGKSTVSFGIANTFAEAGKKTLFIDADMRKSVLQSRYWIHGIKDGLSAFLSGQRELDEIVYKTDISNLFMIPSGVFPTNPTELLSNERLKDLFTSVKSCFDYVIVDTPPIGSVIDAAVIANICDGTIMVISDNTVRRSEAQAITGQLRKAKANILGTVLNKVNTKAGLERYNQKKRAYYYEY